ncbi:hypothetical protein BGZ54_005393 [Gamsiella multidivaricata]|nr:hypothetical protein BGZ54_005393 [Gamsiella multidivaricata]
MLLPSRRSLAGQEKIHVFDIPELLLPICAYLSPHDILQCTLLSRHFHALCIPILYAHISITTPFQFYRFRTPEAQAALARNSIHIRSFNTQYYSLLRCLLSDSVNLHNLTHLEFSRACRFTDPEVPRGFRSISPSQWGNYVLKDQDIDKTKDLQERTEGGARQETIDYKPDDIAIIYERNTETRARNALGLFDETLLIAMLEKCHRLSVFAMVGFPFDHDQLIRRIGDRLAGPDCTRQQTLGNMASSFSMPSHSVSSTRQHLGLRKLELTNHHYCRVKAISIEYLLNHCTPELEELLLSISFGSRAEVGSDEQDMEDLDKQSVDPGVELLQQIVSDLKDDGREWNLRRLAIKGDLSGPGPLVWLPLLRRCTRLQDLCVDLFTNASLEQLALTLSQCCPRIAEMTLRCMAGGPQDDSRIADLIRSSVSWKQLSISFLHGFGPLSTAALIKHSSALETLILEECDGFTSEDIQTILSSCPRLKTFRAMTSNGMDFSSTVYLDAHEMVDSPWMCHRLENLKLVITGIARPDLQIDQYGQPLTGPLHDGTITGFELQRIVYQQLGKLARLQELWLGHDKQDLDDEENYHLTDMEGHWRFIDPDEQFECLEFSLRSGLDLLAGLKELRVVNLDRMKTRIGLSEVQWMTREWPKLERIIGLVVQGEKVPKHVQWLYDHRPDIELPPVLGNFVTTFS